MLLRLLLMGASALIGASIGYNEGKKDAIREQSEYHHMSKYKPSLPKAAKDLFNKTTASIKQAASDVKNSKEYVDFKTKFSKDELMHLLCNNQIMDTVNDILKQNNGEYRPGYYFKGEEWQKYKETKHDQACNCQSTPKDDYIGANVNITPNK